ncbi:hypothetical protein PJWF_00072 [Achromobacter phage JWF]|uniref:hypothetical protein n=1 Tax=Achromobacter phage JWF TaxID=1589748 RepID=UPI000588DF43|nr:hypothetical protein AXJ13_gp116 [Achromobacter phage JWF]AJD82965.1 hypothetical protein PJWF_00072 [Achromobacter phage JWF]
MAYELPEQRPVYIAENKSLCKLVDAAILVLSRVDIEQINRLKEEWIPKGLREALHDENHPFWCAHGQAIFEDINERLKPFVPENCYFSTHPEIPELVGIFQRGDENNIKHRARASASMYMDIKL